MRLVLAVCKDPSGTNGILPVVKELRKNPNLEVRLIANGKAIELLLSWGIEFETFNSPEEVLTKYPKPAGFITSMCNGGIGCDLVPYYRGICPTISMQDAWWGHMANVWSHPKFRPDFMIVNDELSKTFVARAWPDFPSAHLVVTGFPALDKYFGVDTATATRELRQNLELTDPNRMVVLFGGQGTGTGKTFLAFVNALNLLEANVYLLPRSHPTMKDSYPGEVELWNEAINRFRGGTVVATPQYKTSDPLLAGADLIVSMFSTILMVSAVLRKPNIAIICPDGMVEFVEEARGMMDEPPFVTMGCSARAMTQDELVEVTKKALEKKLDLTVVQEKNFKGDGKNAQRVAEFISSLY